MTLNEWWMISFWQDLWSSGQTLCGCFQFSSWSFKHQIGISLQTTFFQWRTRLKEIYETIVKHVRTKKRVAVKESNIAQWQMFDSWQTSDTTFTPWCPPLLITCLSKQVTVYRCVNKSTHLAIFTNFRSLNPLFALTDKRTFHSLYECITVWYYLYGLQIAEFAFDIRIAHAFTISATIVEQKHYKKLIRVSHP